MNIEFDEEKHIYRLNGQIVPGVTTVLDVLPKPWLVPWAAKETINKVRELWLPNKEYSDEMKEEILDKAKKAYREKKEKAADVGTLVHKYLEAYLKLTTPGEKVIWPPDKTALKCIRQFHEWEEKVSPEWLESEVIVGSEEHNYAGKFDAIAEIGKEVYLIDFKTSGGIYNSHRYQLAAYLQAYNETFPNKQPNKRAVLHIPKDGSKVKFHEIESSMSHDLVVFLDCLILYNSLKEEDKCTSLK